jgi:hypothetical protein
MKPEQAEIERLRREVASLRHTPIRSRQMRSFVFGADIVSAQRTASVGDHANLR